MAQHDSCLFEKNVKQKNRQVPGTTSNREKPTSSAASWSSEQEIFPSCSFLDLAFERHGGK